MLFIIIFTILTTIALLLGLISMAAGKKFSKNYGTKLMSLRVFLQGLALISLALTYLLSTS
jgi:hypothetical protein